MGMFLSNKVPEVYHHYLAEGYELGEYDVYCGRGSRSSNHAGNQHYSSLIQSLLIPYVNARIKQHKIEIITEVIQQVRSLSPNGGFIKQDLENWRYFDIGDALAREKISQTFRDAIRSQKSKKPKRKVITASTMSRKVGRDLTKGNSGCQSTKNSSFPCNDAPKLSKMTSCKSNLDNSLFKMLNYDGLSLIKHENLYHTLCKTTSSAIYCKCCDISNCPLSEIKPIDVHNIPKFSSCCLHSEDIIHTPDKIDSSVDIVVDDNTFFNIMSKYSEHFQWDDNNCYEPIPL